MNRILLLAFVTLCVSHRLATGQTVGSSHGHGSEQPHATSLQALLDGVNGHPQVRMKQADVEASKRRIAMHSTLMDPMLMLGIQNLPIPSFSFGEDMMTAKMIGLSQTFPFPGKLAAEEAVSSQDTVTTVAIVSEEVNLLQRDIKLAYFDMYHLTKAIETNREHIRVLGELIGLAESQLAIGKATQQQVLTLKLERSDIESQMIGDETSLAMRTSDLERASGVMVDKIQASSTLPWPAMTISLDALDSLAAHYRPEIAATRSRSVRSGLQRDVAQLDQYPDITVGLTYMQRSALRADAPMNPMNTPLARQMGMQAEAMKQSDMITATVSFSLPINSRKRNEAIAEAEAMQTGSRAEEASALLEIHSMLTSELARLRGIRKEYELLVNEVTPLAEASLATANTNYQYSKTDIEEVMRNQLSVFHREHQKYQLEADYNKAIATIEYLVGQPLVTYQ